MRHDKLDLNLLVALDALLQEGSVSRAADRLFLTQPAMSNALARLRLYFQDELVVPVGRRMVFTEKALAMKDEVRAILLRISAVTRPVAAFEPATARRQFRIAASDYFSAVVLPDLIRLVAAEAPGIHIDVLPLGVRLSEELERGEVDLLIVPSLYAVKGFAARKLFEEEWVCVAWSGSDIAARKLTAERYHGSEHVVKRENHPHFRPIDEWELERRKVARRVAVRVPQYSLLPLAVVGTDRIATVQRRLAQLAKAWLPLKIMDCPFDFSPIEETMQWHSVRELDSGHSWLRNAVARSCASPRRSDEGNPPRRTKRG